MERYHKGIWAERLGALFLIVKGYKILKMRYKTHVGEIDIIAKRGRVFAFIEVKYRPDYEEGVCAISQKAQKRILRTAEYYCMEHKIGTDRNMRFDALILSPPFYVRHLRNAWIS